MIVLREHHDASALPSRASGPVHCRAAAFSRGAAFGTAIRPKSAPLAALSHCDLAQRFHGWRGQSGRRYICSIFASADEAFGFGPAVVIAVARDVTGARHALAALSADTSLDLEKAAFARQPGAVEWHVHLLAASPGAAQAAMDDLMAWQLLGRSCFHRPATA